MAQEEHEREQNGPCQKLACEIQVDFKQIFLFTILTLCFIACRRAYKGISINNRSVSTSLMPSTSVSEA